MNTSKILRLTNGFGIRETDLAEGGQTWTVFNIERRFELTFTKKEEADAYFNKLMITERW